MTILNKEKILEQARIFIEEGRYDKAIREYEKILLADPSDLRIKLRVAELYTKRKQITEAIRIYREVAEAYAAEGFYLKAVTVHKNILRLNPSLIEINEQLAFLYEKMGLMADVVRQYDILAMALEHKGMTDRVLDIREKIVRLTPTDSVARIKLAEAYQLSGRLEEAIDQYETYAKQLEAERADEAKLADVFEKVLAHRPGRRDMLQKLIHIYDRIGDQKKMLKWLEAGGDFIQQDPDFLHMMAVAYASQNQIETARTKYLALADLRIECGDIKGALDAFYEILVLLPDEEERLTKRVEGLKTGAMPALLERAAMRRAELEQLEAHQTASAKEIGHAADAGEKGPPRPAKMAMPEKTSPSAIKGPKEISFDLKEAEASFDLGNVYIRMGLNEEALAEFEKARLIYNEYLKSGVDDPIIKERVARIEAIIAGGVARAEEKQSKIRDPGPFDCAPSERPAGRQGRPGTGNPKRQKISPHAEEEPTKARETTANKKKRVSFI